MNEKYITLIQTLQEIIKEYDASCDEFNIYMEQIKGVVHYFCLYAGLLDSIDEKLEAMFSDSVIIDYNEVQNEANLHN